MLRNTVEKTDIYKHIQWIGNIELKTVPYFLPEYISASADRARIMGQLVIKLLVKGLHGNKKKIVNNTYLQLYS